MNGGLSRRTRSISGFIVAFVVIILVIASVKQPTHAESGERVSSEIQLKEAIAKAPKDGTQTLIQVDGEIEIDDTLTIEAGTNIVLYSAGADSKIVPSVTMNASKSLIHVVHNATLSIEQDNIENALIIDGIQHSNGALIHNDGTLLMYGGIVRGAKGDDAVVNGGGIYNTNVFTMYGGEISNNNAYANSWATGGGGVYSVGTFTMYGGVIENNTAWHETPTGINGGIGGGVLVKAGNASIYGGLIRNNKAGSGGGIYVHGTTSSDADRAKLYLYNTLITQNTAEETGGGLWLCATGITESTIVLGSSILGNSAQGLALNKVGGDDVYSDAKESLDIIIQLPQITLTGEKISWFDDSPNNRYITAQDPVEVDTSNLAVEQNSYYHAEAFDSDLDDIREASSVIIEDNSALMGGGIASNGLVTFGIPSNETSAKVVKSWEDMFDTHPSIDVQLYQFVDKNRNGILDDSEEYTSVKYGLPVTLSEANAYTYEWSKLPKYHVDQGHYSYFGYDAKEATKLDDYVISNTGTIYNKDTNIWETQITNTYVQDKINISGTKTWVDASDNDRIRPEEIIVILYANDHELIDVEPVWHKSGDVWTYTFTNLPKYIGGKEIEYTVTEDRVPGYETMIDGFEITNTYTIKHIDLHGTKTWIDNDNKDNVRPESIELNLYANGKIVQGYTPTWHKEGNVWEYTYTELPQYKDGVIQTYTVREVPVRKYTMTQEGNDITNTYTPTPPIEIPSTGLQQNFLGVYIALCGALLMVVSYKFGKRKENQNN